LKIEEEESNNLIVAMEFGNNKKNVVTITVLCLKHTKTLLELCYIYIVRNMFRSVPFRLVSIQHFELNFDRQKDETTPLYLVLTSVS
jgi:hypothetical protein